MDTYYIDRKMITSGNKQNVTAFFIAIDAKYNISVHMNFGIGKNFFIGKNLRNILQVSPELGKKAILYSILRDNMIMPKEIKELCNKVWLIASGDKDFRLLADRYQRDHPSFCTQE